MEEVKNKNEFSLEELKNELEELKQEYRRMKLDHVMRGLPNPMLLRSVRRDIARINTELRKRQIANMSGEDLASRSKMRARRRRHRKA